VTAPEKQKENLTIALKISMLEFIRLCLRWAVFCITIRRRYNNMKIFVIFSILLFTLVSCDLFESEEFSKDNVLSSFSITDTNGVSKNQFKVGEDFVLTFSVINMSDKPLHYTYSYPIIVYSILSADSVAATSTDYMMYIQPIIQEDLTNAEEFIDFWIGPNTPGRIASIGKLTLPVGNYTARINHSVFFDEYSSSPLEDIDFQVVQ